MAQVVIRNIEDDVKARLEQRASQRSWSMEEVGRHVLRKAAAEQGQPPIKLGSRMAARVAPASKSSGCADEFRHAMSVHTNVLSAPKRQQPNAQVVPWLKTQHAASIWISSIPLFEARFGLALLSPGQRKSLLQERKVNSCLRARVGKGWVKANNFRPSDNKLAYADLLTPRGTSAKVQLAHDFLARKQREFDRLQREIAELRSARTYSRHNA